MFRLLATGVAELEVCEPNIEESDEEKEEVWRGNGISIGCIEHTSKEQK